MLETIFFPPVKYLILKLSYYFENIEIQIVFVNRRSLWYIQINFFNCSNFIFIWFSFPVFSIPNGSHRGSDLSDLSDFDIEELIKMHKLCRQVSIESPGPALKDCVFSFVIPVPDTPEFGARVKVIKLCTISKKILVFLPVTIRNMSPKSANLPQTHTQNTASKLSTKT